MFTNQKLLVIILILFTLGAGGYFTYSRFKSEVSSVTASPSPTPASLEFMLNQPQQQISQQQAQPAQQQPQQAPQQIQPQSQSSERPYFRNKYVRKHPGILTDESLKNKKVVMQTNKGTFEIEIFTDTPIASSNFLLLADGGFYDGLKFHRVEKDFVVYGGDPLGDGTGGPGYTFIDEAVTKDYKKGIVAYFNIGPNTNGSQFFILLTDKQDLPKRYTIFGQVTLGMDVVEKLAVGDVIQKAVIQNLQ